MGFLVMEGSSARQEENDAALKRAMFHDFLSPKPSPTDAAAVYKTVDGSTSASISHGGTSSGGGRIPLSTTSDPAPSERQHGHHHHLEGIPYYGPRDDFSFLDACKRMQKNKRSNSDSAFTESLETLQMKMLKNGGGRRSHDEDAYYNMQQMRPASGTLIVHPTAGARSIPMAAYPARGNQFPNQNAANRFKNNPSVISQTAADEGSRTGMKTPGILTSIDKTNAPPGASKKAEPECLSSTTRQMTIFYNGQAHVFDDVHPNKADVIMAFAGSNGGSWSTTYSPKQSSRLLENSMTGAEPEMGAAMAAVRREPRGRLSIVNNAAGDSTAGASVGDLRKIVKGGESSSEERDKFKFELKGI